MEASLSPLSSRAADLPGASQGWNEHGKAVFAIQAQRAVRQTSAQPGRAGSTSQAVERRRCGTTLFVCSFRRAVEGSARQPLSMEASLSPLSSRPKRSGGICSSADPSWKCFSTERSVVERSAVTFRLSRTRFSGVFPLSHQHKPTSTLRIDDSVIPHLRPLRVIVTQPGPVFARDAVQIPYHLPVTYRQLANQLLVA